MFYQNANVYFLYLTGIIIKQPMRRKLFLIALLSITYFVSFAQGDNIEDAYLDYKVSRNVKGNTKSTEKLSALLKRSNELSVKQVANVEYHLGRMYEEMGTIDSAIVHYENSLKGEPNYSVLHRALGFIYLSKTKSAVAKMNEASKTKDAAANAKAFAEYKVLVKKAIPYLEKYQACDPDEQTLATINNLYKSIKDLESLKTLDARLKANAEKCVSLLEDE